MACWKPFSWASILRCQQIAPATPNRISSYGGSHLLLTTGKTHSLLQFVGMISMALANTKHVSRDGTSVRDACSVLPHATSCHCVTCLRDLAIRFPWTELCRRVLQLPDERRCDACPLACPHPTHPYLRPAAASRPRLVLGAAPAPPLVPACRASGRSSAFRSALLLSRTAIPVSMSREALPKNPNTPVMGWFWGGT